MIQFEMPRQQRYQLVADDESDMPEWAEEYTICNLRSGSDPGPYMFCGGEWVMLSSYAVSGGTLKIYHDVKAGDQPWDRDASEVKEVVIADTVKSIGAGAFSSLENLEYVSIPAGVTVEDGAFSQTFKDPFDADIAMADVAGYEYVAYEGVMYQCDPSIFTFSTDNKTITGLTTEATSAVNLVLPTSHDGTTATTLANSAFQSKTTIARALHLPDSGLTTIGIQAFRGCNALVSISLPSVTTIEHSAFTGCSSLVSVDIPTSVTSIGNGAFSGCTSLTSVSLPPITTIEGTVFYGCTALASVTIPDSVTTIGIQAFRGCTSLASVELPSSLTSIGDHAFWTCTGIQSVAFAEGFSATISSSAFISWTFYAADGTTVINRTDASNLANSTFEGTASRLVKNAASAPTKSMAKAALAEDVLDEPVAEESDEGTMDIEGL